jgi:Flp pilus assembly pilin Flp
MRKSLYPWHGHGYSLCVRKQKTPSQGQTLVEYALIVAFASLIVITFLTFLGQDIVGFFSVVTNTLTAATAS